MISSIALILNMIFAPPSLANELPQGKIEGKEIVGGDGFGGIRTDKACSIEIRGNRAQSSFTGSRSFQLEKVPEERNLYMGMSGDRALFVSLNRDKTVSIFGTQTVVMGERIETEEDRLCAVNVR